MPALTGTRTRSGSVFQRFVAPFRRSCHQLPLRMAISRRPLSSNASTLCRVILVVIVFLRAGDALSERSHSATYAAHVSSTAYAAHVRQTVAIAYDDGLFSICFSTLLIR